MLGDIPQELKDSFAKMERGQLEAIQHWLDNEPFASVIIAEYIEETYGLASSF